MSRSEARSGETARGRRARRVAGLGAQAAQAALLQDLGDALDGAVGALRRGDPLAEGLARRLRKAWLAASQPRVEWLPTELKVGPRVVLTAGGEVGRFLVPAYQAGLRAVTLLPVATVEQVLSFCRYLAALEDGKLHPPAFGRLAWRGELLGLQVVVVESAIELGEALVREVVAGDLWAERSARVVTVWTELAARAQALPAAERAERYGAPLARLCERATAGELELSDDDIVGLMETADDAAGWAVAEVELLLHHPAARSGLSGDQLAWVLSTYVEHAPAVDDALLAVLTKLGLDLRRPPRPGTELDASAVLVGQALARRLLQSRQVPPATLAVLDAQSRELRGVILAALCQHGETRATGPGVLQALTQRYGVTEMLGAVDAAQLGPIMAAACVQAGLASGASPPLLLKLIERMEPQSAFAALAAAPSLCAHAVGIVAQMLAHESSAARSLPGLVRASPEAAAAAGAALLTALERGAELTDLDETMVELLSMGQGRNVVLSVFQRRGLRVATRSAALLALQTDTRLFSDAMHFADGGEEPKELRELLEELRWQEPT